MTRSKGRSRKVARACAASPTASRSAVSSGTSGHTVTRTSLADTTRFQQLESRRGIAPLGGAHFRYLTRTGWGNAMYHLFICEEFSAERALQLGFVQEVHPFGKHMQRARELAAIICECAPLGLRATKKAALTFIEAGEQAAVACIPQIKDQVFATEDFREGIRSFVERRPAKFVGR